MFYKLVHPCGPWSAFSAMVRVFQKCYFCVRNALKRVWKHKKSAQNMFYKLVYPCGPWSAFSAMFRVFRKCYFCVRNALKRVWEHEKVVRTCFISWSTHVDHGPRFRPWSAFFESASSVLEMR